MPSYSPATLTAPHNGTGAPVEHDDDPVAQALAWLGSHPNIGDVGEGFIRVLAAEIAKLRAVYRLADQSNSTLLKIGNDLLGDNKEFQAEITRLRATRDNLVEAMEAVTAAGLIPVSSAADGGANKYSSAARAADQFRAALAAAKEG